MHPFVQSTLGGILIGFASWLLLASLGRIAAGVLVPAKGDTGWRWAFLLGLVLAGAATAHWLQPPPTALRPLGLLVMAGGFWHGSGVGLHQRARRVRARAPVCPLAGGDAGVYWQRRCNCFEREP